MSFRTALFFFAIIYFLLSSIMGCATASGGRATASGSALVTGQTRPIVEDHTTVTILTEMPDEALEIANVEASSKEGWRVQQTLDYAIEELRRQAAAVGANAVVVTGAESSILGGPRVYGSHEMFPSSAVGREPRPRHLVVVQGIAVGVE